jgi:hypothetical protein
VVDLLNPIYCQPPRISGYYALIVTCPFTTFFMLKPTVGIESSLNSPAARTLRRVVFPLFCNPIKVIYKKVGHSRGKREYTSISVRQKSDRSQSMKEYHQDQVEDAMVVCHSFGGGGCLLVAWLRVMSINTNIFQVTRGAIVTHLINKPRIFSIDMSR